MLRLELEDLLFHQAALLEEDRLEEWLELLADDVRYVAPARLMAREEPSLNEGPRVCHFNDGKIELKLRVGRVRTGFAHYNNVPALVRHIISNVRILDVSQNASTVTVASNFAIFRSRVEKEETIFLGARTDAWRRGGSHGWELANRLILLDHHMVPPISVLF